MTLYHVLSALSHSPVHSTYINTTAQIDAISCSFVQYSVKKPIPGFNRLITKINYPHALRFSITSINGYCNWSGYNPKRSVMRDGGLLFVVLGFWFFVVVFVFCFVTLCYPKVTTPPYPLYFTNVLSQYMWKNEVSVLQWPLSITLATQTHLPRQDTRILTWWWPPEAETCRLIIKIYRLRYTVSHPNPSSSPGYPNLDLMMASRGRNMSSYN